MTASQDRIGQDYEPDREPNWFPEHLIYTPVGRFLGEDWECWPCWCSIGEDHDNRGSLLA